MSSVYVSVGRRRQERFWFFWTLHVCNFPSVTPHTKYDKKIISWIKQRQRLRCTVKRGMVHCTALSLSDCKYSIKDIKSQSMPLVTDIAGCPFVGQHVNVLSSKFKILNNEMFLSRATFHFIAHFFTIYESLVKTSPACKSWQAIKSSKEEYTKPSSVCDLATVLHTTPKHTRQMEGGTE